MTNAAATLTAAKALIVDPEHWTQGAYSRNDAAEEVNPTDADATKWCAHGALCHVLGMPARAAETTETFSFLYRAADQSADDPININDDKGHDAVLALYDIAISLAQRGVDE